MRRLLLPALLLLSACHLPDGGATTSADIRADPAPAPARPEGPVAADEPGTIRAVEQPLRGLDGTPSSRVWLLEMYQQAVTAKDELTRKNATLAAERDAAVARTAELERSQADLQARNAALDAEVRDLRGKALELARRLAESELTRLAAEKAALEAPSEGGRP